MTAAAALPAPSPTLEPSDGAVVVRGLHVAYRARAEVLRGVDLVARAGEITVIIGGSGSGKTTLLRVIAGLLHPTSGVVRVLDAPPSTRRADAPVAYVPQQLGLVRARSALDNVLVGALGRTPLLSSLLGRYARADRDRALQLLQDLGIGDRATAPLYSLSGGERQRVAIARALLHAPRVLLADEFVSQLDAHTSRDILEHVREMARAGVAVVVTTHELDVALTFADRIVVLRDGRVVLDEVARLLDEAALMASIRR